MKKNMGLLDRALRTIIAIVIIALYLAGQITGIAALILGIIAVIFLVTSAVSYCPLYVPLKISTIKKE